jgi:radical SAM superfamily enzyme YgiQ (UPF0313 family)
MTTDTTTSESTGRFIVSGSDSADHLDKYFQHKVDYAICGEGEITLGELINQLTNSPTHQLTNINGLAFPQNGAITRTTPRKVLKDLDTLPFPAWELVDIPRYKELWHKHHGYFSMNLVTTRGCPFHCNWCAKPVYGQVYNSHSPEYIARQMKLLKEKYSPDHIWFCDDIFGLKPGWTTSFSEIVNSGIVNSEIVNENGSKEKMVKIPFKCLSRADLLLKEDNIAHLANAGCESLWMGAESGSQKILDAMDKGTTIEEIYESTRLLKKHGIKTCFFLQFGYTGETKSEIDETIRMVNELMPDDIGISVSYPLPGTKFYERVASQMKTKHNWELSDDFEMMFDGEYSTHFYRALHKRVHKEYRTRQLLREPVKRIKHLWKLPAYAGGWWWNSVKVNKLEKL